MKVGLGQRVRLRRDTFLSDLGVLAPLCSRVRPGDAAALAHFTSPLGDETEHRLVVGGRFFHPSTLPHPSAHLRSVAGDDAKRVGHTMPSADIRYMFVPGAPSPLILSFSLSLFSSTTPSIDIYICTPLRRC
eukprot:scaffold22045_cov111-Isochrysis_galbana.AAC.1